MLKFVSALLVWFLAAISVGAVLGMPVAAICLAVGLPEAMAYLAWIGVAIFVGGQAALMLEEL